MERFQFVPQAGVLVVRMVDHRSLCGQENRGHQRHGAGESGLGGRLFGDPLHQFLQFGIAVLAHDAVLAPHVVHAGHAHGADQPDHLNPNEWARV